MVFELLCFEQSCRARFPITEAIYTCPQCGGLLEVSAPQPGCDAAHWKRVWRERRMSNHPADASGVWFA